MTDTPMNATERRELLDEFARLVELLERAEQPWNAATCPAPQALAAASDRISAICARYSDGVPRPEISRCPFTGEAMRHSIDTFGIDGLWWNSEASVRPTEELPATFFAMAGAVDLRAGAPSTEFIVRPGPDAPYVVPRILALPGLRAVVTETDVGGARAWAIAYFAQVQRDDVERIDDWGRDQYAVPVAGSAAGWGHVADVREDFDFDLAPWIRRGRVLWIAPGDATLTLRSTTDDCPYLAIAGRHEPVFVRRGRVMGVFDDGDQDGEGA